MLLEITNTTRPAADLGFLLHKHPAKVQSFPLAFGVAQVFYPSATDDLCTAALLLEVDPIGLVRKRWETSGDSFRLEQYVNDRPYVASSFLSVAIAQVLGTALGGRCTARPELPDKVLSLSVRIAALPCRGGADFLQRLFEPLGYRVTAIAHPLDPRFADWGDSPYYTVMLDGDHRLQDLLSHLYVLIPVLDDDKHYWVGRDELEKLLRHGEGWLAAHPEREAIAYRYLKRQRGLARAAIEQLAEDDAGDPDTEVAVKTAEEERLEASAPGAADVLDAESTPESHADEDIPPESPDVDSDSPAVSPNDRAPQRPLHEQRLQAVVSALRESGANSVVDLGCGEGRLLRLLIKDRQFARIVGVDVSHRSLENAADRLRLDRMPPQQRQRLELLHGSLTYRDERLNGFDAAALVEVIEHLDPPRLAAFERVVFEFMRPRTVVVTTPNREFNVLFPTLPAGRFRHRDHRFEWTRDEFKAWAERVANRFGYGVRLSDIGPPDDAVGAPSQMGVFELI